MMLVNEPTAKYHSREFQVGVLIQSLRRERNLSLRTLAVRSGFSPSFLSQIEHGQASPSIASLDRIVRNLDLSLAEFFHRLSHTEISIVRVAARRASSRSGPGARIESLIQAEISSAFEPCMVTLAPGGTSESPSTTLHAETFAHVLTAEISLLVNNSEYVLSPGDSVTLPAGTAHLWRNDTGSEAQLLLITRRCTTS